MDTSKRVLVVDNSQTTLTIVSRLLHQCGFSDLEHAYSTEEALEALRVKRHPLVISDCHFTGMSGIQFLMAARSDPLLFNTCFILMTARRDRDLIADAVRHQADCILMKPFTADVLRMKLSDMARLKAQNEEVALLD